MSDFKKFKKLLKKINIPFEVNGPVIEIDKIYFNNMEDFAIYFFDKNSKFKDFMCYPNNFENKDYKIIPNAKYLFLKLLKELNIEFQEIGNDIKIDSFYSDGMDGLYLSFNENGDFKYFNWKEFEF